MCFLSLEILQIPFSLYPKATQPSITLLKKLLFWIAIGACVGILSGSASAIFLLSLDWVGQVRDAHLWLIGFLPLAGFGMGYCYHHYGFGVERGNNLILEGIYTPQPALPFRMAPLVLFGTLITHLFGGSAGREGTAVQMGASLAAQLGKRWSLEANTGRTLLICGVAGGFASVFGTPLAGAVFSLEWVFRRKIDPNSIFPAFWSAFTAYWVCDWVWGIGHTAYLIPEVAPFTLINLVWMIPAGIAFGLAARLFVEAGHGVSRVFSSIAYPPLQPLIGGFLVAGIVYLSGAYTYIGLGIPRMVEAFETPLPWYDFLAKTGMTALTLGSGFKGGEVTPLFFTGATLGNALSAYIPLPLALLAGCGFVGVFAGATNTPLASTLMGMELFGLEAGIYLGIACLVAFIFSGRASIYAVQDLGWKKSLP
jgi:H+/Cl- antiporter ClcA